MSVTYDHTHWNIRDPVRSPLVKPVRAEPVLRWVTTGESSVLLCRLRDQLLCKSCPRVMIVASRTVGGSRAPKNRAGGHVCGLLSLLTPAVAEGDVGFGTEMHYQTLDQLQKSGIADIK
ncbi:hypothetical protein MCOR07_003377 [Pyricularia oryzae]|uniref:Uncharacterized protein n=2 Tax=Pyricularia TaxID=48558 RepID=A0ABQ8NZE9_PYRGI|nr:hypothetical protein MCOR01_009745 [Pyricularia oryzae]KAI6304329.1 hypothetical protein MCOR33_000639 [Pyricularia grisea]KAI6340841.1 hypothetical protein MCOR30_002386 [Pyricularia oryzae]KAI6344994.1 hypothetical protein MCOR28_003881 [Pyricularia oryzae]KAI6433475.1 hypothetical protein MCOR21_002839 [Pyricularia oryzae]